MFRNPLNVLLGVEWASSFAAVGTREAVYFLKNFIVSVLHDVIQILGRFLFDAVQKFFVFLLLGLCLFFVKF